MAKLIYNPLPPVVRIPMNIDGYYASALKTDNYLSEYADDPEAQAEVRSNLQLNNFTLRGGMTNDWNSKACTTPYVRNKFGVPVPIDAGSIQRNAPYPYLSAQHTGKICNNSYNCTRIYLKTSTRPSTSGQMSYDFGQFYMPSSGAPVSMHLEMNEWVSRNSYNAYIIMKCMAFINGEGSRPTYFGTLVYHTPQNYNMKIIYRTNARLLPGITTTDNGAAVPTSYRFYLEGDTGSGYAANIWGGELIRDNIRIVLIYRNNWSP